MSRLLRSPGPNRLHRADAAEGASHLGELLVAEAFEPKETVSVCGRRMLDSMRALAARSPAFRLPPGDVARPAAIGTQNLDANVRDGHERSGACCG